ncbi:lipid biosynthesis B12-binding/radical SAM protein [Desulfococcaceae bacterium HSG9]|nr:lipid biosynthesis B12-binding/radical SAM protein [Desulfococcaceae bacterium HSG9]
MNILLISANTLTTPYPVYPLGLDYVAGSIAPSHKVQIADMNVIDDYAALGKLISAFEPHIVGLALRNVDNTDATDSQAFMDHYKELAITVRRCSQALLVLGGSGFTLFPREMMQVLKADYGVIGEGEHLTLLLDAIQNKTDVTAIPGVICRTSSQSAPVPWEEPLTRHFEKHTPYIDFYLRHGGMLNLQTKRGCCYNCIYCTYPHIEGRRLRLFPPEDVAVTATRLQAAGAKYFFITDSVFNADYEHSLDVAHAFKKAGVSIPWGAFFAPTKPPPDYYKSLAEAGLTHVEFGTEALSNRMLESLRKPFQRRHVYAAHRNARDAGLYTAHYFLFGGPGEDVLSLDTTLNNIEKLDRAALFFFCGVRIYPGAALSAVALKQGQITPIQNLLAPVFYRSQGISEREIIQRVRTRADGRPNWIIGSGGVETSRILARMYDRGFSGPLWEYLIR